MRPFQETVSEVQEVQRLSETEGRRKREREREKEGRKEGKRVRETERGERQNETVRDKTS